MAALPLFGIAIAWGWTFGFTHFRSHQRFPMLVFAAAIVVYALLLMALNRWVVLSSICLAALGAAAAIYIQVLGGYFTPFLAMLAVISLVYAGGLGWALKANQWRVRD